MFARRSHGLKTRVTNDPSSMASVGIGILFFAAVVNAQTDSWTLTTADFKTQQVTLKGIDSSGLKVQPADSDQEQTVPLDKFLDVQRIIPSVASTAKFVLQLSGGDKLAGDPVNLTAEALVWKNPALGEISIPTGNLLGLTRALSAGIGQQGREDIVGLANGDSVRGIIASMSSDKVTVQMQAGNNEVPLSSVASITFASIPGARAPQHGFRVRFDEGSSLVGSEARLEGNDLVLTLGKKVERKVPLVHVAALEQVNGPVSWLSTRMPSEQIYYPFIGPPRQPAAYMDRSWNSPSPIEFKGQVFPHGIAVHAFSRLVWPLDGKYQAFRTLYAVEGESRLDEVTVRIKMADKIV
jgi:hypothetical protein